MADFTYMGTKKAIATKVAGVCDFGSNGPLLELFSGLSAVGRATNASRPLWCNDVQRFSNLYCEVLFATQGVFLELPENWATFERFYSDNVSALNKVFGTYVEREKELWDASNHEEIADWEVETFPELQSAGRALDRRTTYHLFTTTYALGYWGIAQAIQADSIRSALDKMFREQLVGEASYKLALLALCRAVSNASNSTGHFAQYLTPSAKNLGRVRQKRKVCIVGAFRDAMEQIRPIADEAWRKKNRIFSGDAISLTSEWPSCALTPEVVYADPPYTNDQYSRYYHVLETVVLYDYPAVFGKGRYRPGRFVSEFSLVSCVESAFKELIKGAADLECCLVISYPDNGLLPNSTEVIPELLATYFPNVLKPLSIAHQHSTMGASKGPHKHEVSEWVFVGQP